MSAPSCRSPQMKIDRPGADGAAAGQRHARLAAARQQRPEHPEACPHARDELVRRRGVDDRARGKCTVSPCTPFCRAACRRPPCRRRDCRDARQQTTSASRGRLRRVRVSSDSSEAIISGRAAFFAPLIGISPWSRRPPSILILSMWCAFFLWLAAALCRRRQAPCVTQPYEAYVSLVGQSCKGFRAKG